MVPSFLGKSVRCAIEMAEDSGLDLDARRQRSGARAVSGCRIARRGRIKSAVKFDR